MPVDTKERRGCTHFKTRATHFTPYPKKTNERERHKNKW